MFPEINRPLGGSLPLQQCPLALKMKDMDSWGVSEWCKGNLDGLEQIGRFQFFNNLKLKENYDIINGRFILQHYLDSEDYFDLASAISQEFQLPKYLKHYDITSKAVNLLLGEFLKRPDIFRVLASDEETTNEKIRLKTELLQKYMEEKVHQEITQQLIQMGIDPNKSDFKTEEEADKYKEDIQQKYQEMTPEAIEKYMRYDYRSAAESWGQAVLNNDKERFLLREHEKIEFTNMLVADRCFTHFFLIPTGYFMETWNPLNTFFHQSPEVRHVEDGDYVGRTFYMSKAQILDRIGWRMTQEQQEALYPEYNKALVAQGTGYSTMFQTWVYPMQNYDDFKSINQALGSAVGFNPLDQNTLSSVPLMNEYDNNTVGNSYSFMQNDLVQVTEAYWRSQRKVGHLNITNPETGEVETKIVDETFDPKLFNIEVLDSTFKEHNEPDTIVWIWTNQIWQGIKINENHLNSTIDTQKGRKGLYVDIRPCDFQFKGDFNIFNPKLPVCGGVFNNYNGRSMSIVDLLKPYQILYNAIYNQCYGIIQRNNGKAFLMDQNILPHNKDWGGEEAIEKFKSVMDATGLGIVDSSPANLAAKGGSNFQHYQVIDLDESDKVTRLFNIAQMVEEQGFYQIGITRQRQGQTQASETATGVNQAINNSYAITETYFENYYNYKKRRLQMHLDIAQFCATQGSDITIPYITSDLGNSFLKINANELMLKDLGINITNAADEQRALEMAQQLVLKNNTTNIPMSKLIELLHSKNLNDIKKTLEQAESDFNKQEQAKQKAEQDMEKQKIDQAKQMQQEQQEFTANENALNRQRDIQVAVIKSEGSAELQAGDEGVNTLAEQGKIALDRSKVENDRVLKQLDLTNKTLEGHRKNQLENRKLDLQKEMQDKEHKLKREEINSKKQLENKKATAEKQRADQDLKVAKVEHKNDLSIHTKELEKLNLEKKHKEELHNLDKKSAEHDLEIEKKLSNVKVDTAKKISKIKVIKAKRPAPKK